MDAFVAAALGAFLGALFGGVALIAVEGGRHRREMAMTLFSDFNTPDILHMRADAEQILDTHIRRSGLDLSADSEIRLWSLEESIPNSDYIKVLSFLHMFEKVVILYENDRADRKVMRELLGRLCKAWYQKYVRRMTSERSETAELLEIIKRMKQIATIKEKLKEF